MKKSDVENVKALLWLVISHVSDGWFKTFASVAVLGYFLSSFIAWGQEQKVEK